MYLKKEKSVLHISQENGLSYEIIDDYHYLITFNNKTVEFKIPNTHKTQPEKLKKIKDKLDNNLPTAPLYNTPLFTRHLESAYLTMYEKYQQGLDPDHIYVEH